MSTALAIGIFSITIITLVVGLIVQHRLSVQEAERGRR